jgi:hypothetical protein
MFLYDSTFFIRLIIDVHLYNTVMANMHKAFDKGLWFWLPTADMMERIAQYTTTIEDTDIHLVSVPYYYVADIYQCANSLIDLWHTNCISISFGHRARHEEGPHPPQDNYRRPH